MRRKLIFILLPLIGLISITSCEKEVDEREADELLRLEAYMSIHYPNAKPLESGLYYIVIQEGEGDSPEDGNYLLYNFTGRNLDDKVYETTHKETAKLYDLYTAYTYFAPYFQRFSKESDSAPKGLIEGLSYMQEGSVVKLIMPSKLAYGSKSHGGMHPYSSLIMDVELKKIVEDPEAYEEALIYEYINEQFPELSIEDAYQDSIYILFNSVRDIPFHEHCDSIHVEDKVTLHYTGRFLDGWVFDTNEKEVAKENDTYQQDKAYTPLEVEVGSESLIQGFSLALQNLMVPSTAIVLIPSKFAYGKEGSSNIRPYSPLLFTLTILDKEVPEEEDEEDDSNE